MSFNVKQAVGLAKQYFAELYEHDNVQDLALEEVFFDSDEGAWRVTLGFSRPLQEPTTALGKALAPKEVKRHYKTITIDNSHGHFKSLEIREVNA